MHHLAIADLLKNLQTSPEKGLSEAEIPARQAQYGKNELSPPKTESALSRFLRQLNQPLIYILLGSSLVSFFLGEIVDASVILLVVLLNSIIGYFQETGALRALEALKKTVFTQALVLRDGKKIKKPASELVVGDIVFLASGDKVPADLRLLEQKELQANESSLTGESLPASKNTAVLSEDTVLGDQSNMVFASTYITRGQASGLVVRIGDQTEIGKISKLIAEAPSLETPLAQKINQFSTILLYLILAMALITFIVGLFKGESVAQMWMVAVALSVGAIPEGLPAAITTILAVGVYKMAKNNAIARKLPVVETLGSTTVICSDKTGTLTENQMTVHYIYTPQSLYFTTGTGYAPEGEILVSKNSQKADYEQDKALLACLQAGLYCNDSQLVKKNESYFIEGDPTEGALLVSAAKAGLDIYNLPTRLDTIPFESERQFMAVLIKNEPQNIVYLKGSAGKIVEKCSYILDTEGNYQAIDKEQLLQETYQLASAGERVLAMAMKISSQNSLESPEALDDCVFLGLQAMIDPPRQAVFDSIVACKNAGIQIKMITGDHIATAKAIAEKLQITHSGNEAVVIMGRDLEKMSAKEFSEKIMGIDVFARVSPEQKLRLVEEIQKQNQVVAMTGDGVNDAPALKQADIGIAMGITGTEVSKEAADMILTDDNFKTIRLAVEQGRAIFDNLLKFIVWTLPTNIGQGTVIFISVFLNISLPILPVQILWINLTTAGILGLTLAFEPQESDIMKRKPRKPNQRLISFKLTARMFLISIVLVVASFMLYAFELDKGRSPEVARTAAVTAFVVIEIFFLFNCRSLHRPLFTVGFFSNMWVWLGSGLMMIVQMFYIYEPNMNYIFSSAPLGWDVWLLILLLGLFSFIIIELEKFLTAKY
ncbi:MAG: HAD-IC family P-type ATPase [Microscillaceae bacterium]|jgi:Ca2+-transporting ATPase|nr:HAD-IC family P-type ATPase [Microscillaceae bacterium]